MKAGISTNVVETRFNRTSLEKPFDLDCKNCGRYSAGKIKCIDHEFHLEPA